MFLFCVLIKSCLKMIGSVVKKSVSEGSELSEELDSKGLFGNLIE